MNPLQDDGSRSGSECVQVALPVPLRQTFDYIGRDMEIGSRVLVPFGSRRLVGTVLSRQPKTHTGAVKPVLTVLDSEPVLPADLFALLIWSARYYHHPVGEVFQTALPARLRQSKPMANPNISRTLCVSVDDWRSAITEQLSRAPKQRALLSFLAENPGLGSEDLNHQFPGWRAAAAGLLQKDLVNWIEIEQNVDRDATLIAPVTLSTEQQVIRDEILRHSDFQVHLLHGVTGSGKTEIYLDLARRTLDDGRQVLFLIPEISLTPQFVQRVRDGLNYPVAVQHSGLSDRDRFRHWWRARSSEPVFVLGTRSAVFAPCPNLGLIIVDEEHDLSYKQADGFRYHARNLAIKRAELTQATVVLGSATPSLESYARAKDQNKQSHWHLHRLKQRYGSSTLPDVHLVDLNLHPSKDGLTEPLLANLRQTLNDGQQALVFVNRRGFAPVLHCVSCGWQSKCSRCDARMTLHQSRQQLRCHHCGRHIQSIEHCPDCNTRLLPIGAGTQRAVQGLQSAFPEARIIRLDRDNITSQDDLNLAMGDIRERRVDMIVGTQLISKGHDFPNVTLVAALNADQGLFGVDFRSSEQLFQQLVQVAGRAGRREVRGRVLIQSHYPQNALFEHIRQQDYTAFAASALEERQVLMFPPYSHMAIWRAESTDAEAARVFLLKVSELGQSLADENNFEACELFDVLPSPLERLAGRYRFQLPVKSRHRGNLHRWLQQWTRFVEGIKEGRRTRWSLDIDPMDMY